jgi:hypothetical protein
MANWCMNTVKFYGDEQQIKELKSLFRKLARIGKKTSCGQRPDFATGKEPSFFDIMVSAKEKNRICYYSKRVPNNAVLKEVADHFKLDFINTYAEPEMEFYGEASYKNGVLRIIRLDTYDKRLLNYDREQGGYVYEGQVYDDEWPVCVKLVERKKAFVNYDISMLELFDRENAHLTNEEIGELHFQDENDISIEGMTEFYGYTPKGLDLLAKYAEQANFTNARAVFNSLDKDQVDDIQRYVSETFQYLEPAYYKNYEYVAMQFIHFLLKERDERQRDLPEDISPEQWLRKLGR